MRQFNPVARGSVLLEALVGMLIFSIGILALVAMQAESIRNTSEARYRNDASYLANQIIGRMWADRPNLASYAHKPARRARPPVPPRPMAG
jgi:type IV pilus assembly protein PilV